MTPLQKIAVLLASLLVMGFSAPIQAATPEEETQPRTLLNGDFTLNYRIYVPTDLPKEEKIPLLLMLHGAGERGDDNARQLINGVPFILSYLKSRNQPAIILMPQCPKEMRWVEVSWAEPAHTMPAEPSVPMKAVKKLLEETMKEFPIDPQRVYVTGLSMGGFGTWDIIQRYPDLFAAALPICGGGDTAQAERLKNMPIWAFHGSIDKVVIPERSRNMIAAIKKAGGQPIYTEYPGVGHVSWTQTYSNHAVMDWLFAQEKKAPVQSKP